MTELSEAPSRAEIERALVLAVSAPSIHNTQPWRWVYSGGVLELHADRERQLGAVDPDGKALLISCGGALHLAQLALAAIGWRTEVDRRSDPGRPDLLARIRPVGRQQPDEATVELARAAERRRTERRPFRSDPVPADLVQALVTAAAGQGVYAHPVERSDERLDLAVVFSWADQVETTDQAYRTELAQWMRGDETARKDGVPASAVPHVPAGAPRHVEVPVRDFEAGVTGQQQLAEPVDEQPVYLVVLTTADDVEARLRAGEAYARVTVEAERLGLGSSALTQAVDLPAVRERFRTLMNWVDHPQMVLRVGWPPSAEPAPPTPRRPLSEVLTVED